MINQPDLESTVQERLDELKPFPERDPQAVRRGRARFLAQAVPTDELRRHKGWNLIFRKEQFAMNIIISILVIGGLLFGGGATVNAAQDDLPNEPLYAVKTFSEDVSLQFQNSPREKVERLMELAQTRVQEMTQLIESGQTPPDQVRLRLEEHLQQTLQLCSNMEDAELDQALLQLRDQLRQQDRDMQRLQTAQDTQPILERTRTMLQIQLQLVNDGLLDHQVFRNTVRNGFRYEQTQTPPPFLTSTPSAPNGQQNRQSTPQADPNPRTGPNTGPGGPNPSMTPMPNNGGSAPGSGNNAGANGGKSSGDNGSGGGGSGGDDSGDNGSGGEGSGGNGSSGEGTGNNGSGGNGP